MLIIWRKNKLPIHMTGLTVIPHFEPDGLYLEISSDRPFSLAKETCQHLYDETIALVKGQTLIVGNKLRLMLLQCQGTEEHREVVLEIDADCKIESLAIKEAPDSENFRCD